jgi:small-conductance mechanosensitive channel
MSELFTGLLNRFVGADHQSALQQLGQLGGSVFLALIVAAISLYAAGRAGGAIHRYFQTRGDLGLAILLGRIAYFLILFIGLLMVLRAFGVDATTLFAALGIVGLAVSLALQDVLKNVFAGIYLLVERPFLPGEIIKVRDFVGTVESIGLRTTMLRHEGELVFVPNAILFSEILINRGSPTITPTSLPE